METSSKKSVDRSAKDGKFVTKKFAKKHPATTVHETSFSHTKNNKMKNNNFESQFKHNDKVIFKTKHNKNHKPSQKGVVVGVRFLENKVLYDVRDLHYGVTNRDVESNDVTADTEAVKVVSPAKEKKVAPAKKAAAPKKAKAVKAPVAKKESAKSKSKSKAKK